MARRMEMESRLVAVMMMVVEDVRILGTSLLRPAKQRRCRGTQGYISQAQVEIGIQLSTTAM